MEILHMCFLGLVRFLLANKWKEQDTLEIVSWKYRMKSDGILLFACVLIWSPEWVISDITPWMLDDNQLDAIGGTFLIISYLADMWKIIQSDFFCLLALESEETAVNNSNCISTELSHRYCRYQLGMLWSLQLLLSPKIAS